MTVTIIQILEQKMEKYKLVDFHDILLSWDRLCSEKTAEQVWTQYVKKIKRWEGQTEISNFCSQKSQTIF
jgi:hypothetical protein